jgi:hypothetical protein
MRQFLLNTNILGAYLLGRPGAVKLAQEWIHNEEAATSIIVYGEITEYIKGFPNYTHHQSALRTLLRKVHPFTNGYIFLLGQQALFKTSVRRSHYSIDWLCLRLDWSISCVPPAFQLCSG